LLKENIIQYFTDSGYVQIDPTTYQQFTIVPDLLFEKENELRAVVLRDTADELKESIVQRFAASQRIPNKALEIFFGFPEKPGLKILSACKNFLVGVLYIDRNGQVELYAESKKIKGRKQRSAVPATHIFVSSIQELEERQEVKKIVDIQRESLRVPIFPMLVEDDQRYENNIKKIWPIICDCMDECDYVTVILRGEHVDIIEEEIRRALELYDPAEILFYVKNDKVTKDAWELVLRIATQAGVKYTEYFDVRDLYLKFNKRIMQVIKHLHDKHGVPFLG
jgi:hypothetical protein